MALMLRSPSPPDTLNNPTEILPSAQLTVFRLRLWLNSSVARLVIARIAASPERIKARFQDATSREQFSEFGYWDSLSSLSAVNQQEVASGTIWVAYPYSIRPVIDGGGAVDR